MNEEHWLIDSSRLRVKRFIINKLNKHKFLEYMYIDTGKISWCTRKRTAINAKEGRIEDREGS